MIILTSDRLKALSVKNGELVHRILPVLGGPPPVSGDVAQSQPDQLAGRLVAREMPPCLEDLAQTSIDAFNRIGRVDYPAYLWREGKKRNDLIPVSMPCGGNRWEFLPPRARLESFQLCLGGFGAGRGVNRLDSRC